MGLDAVPRGARLVPAGVDGVSAEDEEEGEGRGAELEWEGGEGEDGGVGPSAAAPMFPEPVWLVTC